MSLLWFWAVFALVWRPEISRTLPTMNDALKVYVNARVQKMHAVEIRGNMFQHVHRVFWISISVRQ